MRSFNKPFTAARKAKRAILEDYFDQTVRERMKAIEKVWPTPHKCLWPNAKTSLYCLRDVEHDHDYCPRHLRLSFTRELSFRLKRAEKDEPGSYPLPAEVRAKLRSIRPPLDRAQFERCQCRFREYWRQTCGMPVDQFPLIGFCRKHIHSSQAVAVILLRHHILESDILIPELRRLVVAYI
jgi:hypothetical protein